MDNSGDDSHYIGGGHETLAALMRDRSAYDSLGDYHESTGGYYDHARFNPDEHTTRPKMGKTAPKNQQKPRSNKPAFPKKPATKATRQPSGYYEPKHAPSYYDSDSGSESDSEDSSSSDSSAGGYGPPPTQGPKGKRKAPRAYMNHLVGDVSGGGAPPAKRRRAPTAHNTAVQKYMREHGGSLAEASRAVSAARRR